MELRAHYFVLGYLVSLLTCLDYRYQEPYPFRHGRGCESESPSPRDFFPYLQEWHRYCGHPDSKVVANNLTYGVLHLERKVTPSSRAGHEYRPMLTIASHEGAKGRLPVLHCD